MKSSFVRLTCAALMLLFNPSCSDRTSRREGGLDEPPANTAAAGQAETSTPYQAPHEEPPPVPSVASQSEAEQAPPSSSRTESDSASSEAPASEPPNIFEIMRNAGYQLQSDRDLADYLPIPPGAEGQVGQFVRAEESVSVARVTYPAEIFADPHENWIRERMRLLAEGHERVVRQSATVIHIVARSDRSAEEVVEVFMQALGLSPANEAANRPQQGDIADE